MFFSFVKEIFIYPLNTREGKYKEVKDKYSFTQVSDGGVSRKII